MKTVKTEIMTIKIFDPNNASSIEVGNNGENEPNELTLTINADDKEPIYFSLSKDEAKELITYLKKEFKI